MQGPLEAPDTEFALLPSWHAAAPAVARLAAAAAAAVQDETRPGRPQDDHRAMCCDVHEGGSNRENVEISGNQNKGISDRSAILKKNGCGFE